MLKYILLGKNSGTKGTTLPDNHPNGEVLLDVKDDSNLEIDLYDQDLIIEIKPSDTLIEVQDDFIEIEVENEDIIINGQS